MNDSSSLRMQPLLKTDSEWFLWMCDLLKKFRKPTTQFFTLLLGEKVPNTDSLVRGSELIKPFDDRFSAISINPILSEGEDRRLEYLGFHGRDFDLKASKVIQLFPEFKTHHNTYDGGYQVFFYLIPSDYEFTALEFWVEEDGDELVNLGDLIFKNLIFRFGPNLTKGRDGYGMRY